MKETGKRPGKRSRRISRRFNADDVTLLRMAHVFVR